MTTLDNRPNTALLVIDVQNGVVADAYDRDTHRRERRHRRRKARAAEVPVVWVQHASDNLSPGSEQWKIVPELNPDESEPLIPKRYPDSSKRRPSSRSSPTSPWGASSLSARRRTNACARRCTARSFGDTTRPSSAMHTRPRTLALGRAATGARYRAHQSLLG